MMFLHHTFHMFLQLGVRHVVQTTVAAMTNRRHIAGAILTTVTDGIIAALVNAIITVKVTCGVQLEVHGNIVEIVRQKLSKEDNVLHHFHVACI
ncbi:hypothetical protein ACJMK2_021313 [Sinanodonta woodiana]|uniref:Secreted protein n=1 Tax=Sinanodonta woodiana TaxID=1069815 RepID=A0ABD3THP4_SINWO